VRGLLLDFNGTISDDEPVLFAIFRELFADAGRPLTELEYYAQLAGLSDPETVDVWLGPGHPRRQELLDRKTARYRAVSADGSTVPGEARVAVRLAAEHVPVVIVSGSARAEIEPVLRAAGLLELVLGIVSADDVRRGKPDPEGYLSGLRLIGVPAGCAVAVEDTETGVAAAKAAGLRCIALRGTLPADRLAAADELADRLDATLIERMLE
jgi:beta-phosphoglucomutase